jgi:hypothetical protein
MLMGPSMLLCPGPGHACSASLMKFQISNLIQVLYFGQENYRRYFLKIVVSKDL